MLPELICRYAAGFGRPSLNMGTLASRVYDLEEPISNEPIASQSNGRGLQRVCAAMTELRLNPMVTGEKRGRRRSVRDAIPIDVLPNGCDRWRCNQRKRIYEGSVFGGVSCQSL